MTNQEAKQEAIKKSYGKWFSDLEDLINLQGTVTRAHVPNKLQNIFGDYFWDNKDGEWWPKSITGIYNNNGWIRIEPDGSNLPEFNQYKRFKIYSEKFDFAYRNSYDWSELMDKYKGGQITHYKPITPEPKPIY